MSYTNLIRPGNHDYWTSEASLSSKQIYEFYASKPDCLIGKPYVVNDHWAIAGHTAWYDYSYADDKFDLDRIKRGKYYGATWQDKVKMIGILMIECYLKRRLNKYKKT